MASEKVQSIIDQLNTFTVLEISELSKALQDAWGVSAAVAMAPGPGAATGGGGAPAAPEVVEQTEFSAVLTEVGPNKIPVIKVVRELTGLGLKEAKDVVDSAPKAIKEGVAREEAEQVKAKLADVGATVEIR